jgi:hypothetical protein
MIVNQLQRCRKNSMNITKHFVGKLGIVLCSAMLGYTTYGQPSVSVGVTVPLPSLQVALPTVEIHTESDFYEPLTPHGEWVVVGSYGRCWRPGRVEAGWRPYCNGNWERTEAGWYWASDEPWAWATYHYGRWDFTEQYGWYWVPQTQWAPAWVSWHEGGGYVGWAPLLPSVRISASGFVGFNVAVISPRAFVFVEQRGFLNPIRPTTVVINNTTIINKTVNITNTKIVNNTVINEGPATAAIEKASGRKVQAVAVKELRHKQESAVVKQRTSASPSEKKVPTPVPGEAEPRGKRAVAVPESTKPAPGFKPEARTEANRPEGNKQRNEAKANEHVTKQEKPATRPSDKKVQRPAKGRPATSEKNRPNTVDRDQGKKPN